MANLANKIAKRSVKRSGTVWTGPSGEGPNGGITFSMLSRFLCCRERFRLLVVEGLKPAETFNPRMEYGNMWHVCEEALAGCHPCPTDEPLRKYCASLERKYPFQREQIAHWQSLCVAQFPMYVAYWAQHAEVVERTPLLQEQVFDVPYRLPSGRIVRLRGKWDAVDLIGTGKTAGVYVQEDKTKSQINQQKIARQMKFDLQTMIYVTALENFDIPTLFKAVGGEGGGHGGIKGVRYNVVRRSAHKSAASMLKKISEDLKDGRGVEWFARWNVAISSNDVLKFRTQCLDPILEQLCEWWDWVVGKTDPYKVELYETGGDTFHAPRGYGAARHWRHPFGVYNVLDEGGSGDLDEYLDTGSKAGLQQTDKLFTELNP